VFTCDYEQYKKLVFTILLVAEVDYTSFIHWYLLYSCEFSNSTGCCRMIDVFLYQCNFAEWTLVLALCYLCTRRSFGLFWQCLNDDLVFM